MATDLKEVCETVARERTAGGHLRRRARAVIHLRAVQRVRRVVNAVERALRGVVVGRKNHYGSRSVRGTEVAAVFYSLVETTKLCGLDPDHYLKVAANAAIDSIRIPLPHELAATLGSA